MRQGHTGHGLSPFEEKEKRQPNPQQKSGGYKDDPRLKHQSAALDTIFLPDFHVFYIKQDQESESTADDQDGHNDNDYRIGIVGDKAF